MKISFNFDGADPVEPDFQMLLAALDAVQSATPTARANAAVATAINVEEALVRLFGDGAGERPAGLDGSFHPRLPQRLPREKER